MLAKAVMSNDGLAGAAAGLRGGGSVRSVRVALVSSNSLLVAESATCDNNLSELITTLPNPFSAHLPCPVGAPSYNLLVHVFFYVHPTVTTRTTPAYTTLHA